WRRGRELKGRWSGPRASSKASSARKALGLRPTGTGSGGACRRIRPAVASAAGVAPRVGAAVFISALATSMAGAGGGRGGGPLHEQRQKGERQGQRRKGKENGRKGHHHALPIPELNGVVRGHQIRCCAHSG